MFTAIPLLFSSGLATILALVAVVVPLAGQAPPGQPTPARAGVLDAALEKALKSRVDLGRSALKAGRHAEGRDHFLSALAYGPASPSLLLDLVKVSIAASDEDARLLWAIRYWAAAADERGRFKLAREDLRLLPRGEKTPATLAAARAAAVDELAKFASKRQRGRAGTGRSVLVRWASDLAWELMRDAPSLQAKYGPVFNKACADEVADYATVIQTLRKIAAGSIKPKPASQEKDGGDAASIQALDEAVIRATRCLTGMAAQARFKDRKGPPPPSMDRDADAAKQARAKIREKIGVRVGVPLTLAQLRAMPKNDRERYTAEHATWANPGLSVSPTGKYRIETICGFETLLGVTETVEMHHARLAGFFGKDPFVARQGLVRVVPASSGLESEDAPFWWAGGFQSGDRTTVKFNWDNHEALGHLLTHELTHRFDGTIYAFLPSWLVEGKAVWTGGSYQIAEDKTFVERLLNTGPCASAFIKGYGGQRNLEKLVTGKLDDYRDNYTAGYALYVFLSTWKVNGEKLFATRLQEFMLNARAGRKKPLAWFVNKFADGKEGRPKNLKAFARMFHDFLHGCYQTGWNNAPAWIRDYRRGFGKPRKRSGARQTGYVMDEPTWVWVRDRAEPWFGQRHAADAGRLFAEIGETRPAVAALLWSLGTDDWQLDAARLLARLLDQLHHSDVAWAVRAEISHRGLSGEPPVSSAPMLAKLPRVRGWFAALRTTAQELHTSGRAFAARELLREHNAIAWRVGEKVVPPPGIDGKKKDGMYPTEPRPLHLGAYAWTESGLTGYEERRVRHLWYQTDSGDVHVGRKRPRKDSGLLDRTAHQRHAFVRSVEWFGPGNYVFKTRVHFTTSFVSGAIVFGYARRDRNIKIGFSAGDFLYAIGRKNDAAKTNRVRFTVGGMWRREGYLRLGRRDLHAFKKPSSHFDIEARVTGATIRVYIDGEYKFSYTTPDLSPILGSIGFAMGQGAVRLQNPTILRLSMSAQGEPKHRTQLLGRKLEGVPLDPHGTIAVWLPGLVTDDDFFDYETWTATAIKRLAPMVEDNLRYPQKWAVMIPAWLPEATKKVLRELAGKRGFSAGEHKMKGPLIDSVYGMYVDARGGVRAISDLLREGVGLPGSLERWARVSRAPR